MLRRHRIEILHDHVAEAARGHPDRDDLVGLQRVNVDLHDRFVPHDEHAIGAELGHLRPDFLDRPRGMLHQELHVVRARPGGHVARDRSRGRGLRPGRRCGDGRTSVFKRGERTVQQIPEALRAGIDHARGLVHRVLQARARDRLGAGIDDAAEHRREIARVVGRGVLDGGRDGQDRARRRRAHGIVRMAPSEVERSAKLAVAEIIGARESVLQTADDLREDHAAVAARAHERAVCRRRAHRGEGRLGRARVLQRRVDGVDHVRSGVPVRDRIHVERVHLVDRALETIGGGFKDAQQSRAVTLRRDARDSTIDLDSPS